MTINASAKVNECEVHAELLKITITGVPIPDDLISERLENMYHGPTARLMTGLAQVESSYMQFSSRTLYDRSDLWPRESYDGGSHIGLMQVEITMGRAWDWLENTQTGVNLFHHDKISIARFWQRQIRQEARDRYGCHLGPLNSVELENMALVLYGEHAMNAIDGQYYYYQVTPEGNCEWVVNTQGNNEGVEYANTVRNSMR